MPSRKQRRRELKAKRHEYEFVYVDADGNELDEAPPELLEQEEKEKKARTNGAKATTAKQPARGSGRGRSGRVPPEPSWNRAFKRAAMLGAVVFALFALSASKSNNRYLAGLIPAAVYTILFVPFTYYIDRFAYRRYQAKLAAGDATPQRPAKKKS
jgi:hypothetical protein